MAAEIISPLPQLDSVDHWLIFVNLGSTNAARAQHQLDRLKSDPLYGPQMEEISFHPAEPNGPERAEAKLLQRLSDGSAVAIAGGDGTTSRLVDTLLSDTNLAHLRTPLLSVAAGYGDDIAISHTGKPGSLPLADILRRGQVTPIRPIETYRFNGDSVTRRLAVAYTSIGSTALGARLFDGRQVRGSWLNHLPVGETLRRVPVALQTILQTGDYEIQPDGKEPRVLSELTVAHYGREARFGRWPIRPTDPMVYVSESGPHSLARSVAWIGRLASGSILQGGATPLTAPPGEYRSGSWRYRFTTISDNIPIQWDGEYSTLPAGTMVDIGLGNQSFYAVTTHL